MKKLQPKYYRTLCLALLSAVLLMALSACSHDDAQDYDGMPDVVENEGSQFLMSVTLMTNSDMTTRAGDHKDDSEEKGNAAENYIDIDGNDFRVVLFDKQGNYLMEIDANALRSSLYSFEQGGVQYYVWEGEVELPSSSNMESIKQNGFQVMALANWQNAKGQWAYSNLFANGTGTHQTLANIWKDGTNHNFSYSTANGDLSWTPDHTASTKRLIPMFGIAEASLSEVGNAGGIVLRSETKVQMQRAVAKIEVIDNIEQDGISIGDVTMSKYNTSGRLIPDVAANPNWNVVGSQVGTSSVPNAVGTASGLKFLNVTEGGKSKWVAYVPEMALDKPSTDNRNNLVFPNGRASLQVKINSTLGDVYEGGTYTAHFAKYNDKFEPTIPDESWNHILRNHIYRFSVNKVGVTAELELHVKPWVLDSDEDWDFTDHVMIAQTLEWKKDSYESMDENTGRVVLWLEDDKDKILTGAFRIASPVNGTWYARLTPLDDAKPNAITFVNKDGDVMEPSVGDPPVCLEVSGIIEQEVPARIYIKPTNFGNDDMSAFRLDFFVENLGVWIQVPMEDFTDENNYTRNYYTIVRKGNKLE